MILTLIKQRRNSMKKLLRKKLRLIFSMLILIVIVVTVIVAAIPKSVSTELTYEAMTEEWATEYTNIEPGQFISQFSIPGEAVITNLTENEKTGFDAISLWVKVDYNENSVVVALRSLDGKFLQKFPTCPPYCDATDVSPVTAR